MKADNGRSAGSVTLSCQKSSAPMSEVHCTITEPRLRAANGERRLFWSPRRPRLSPTTGRLLVQSLINEEFFLGEADQSGPIRLTGSFEHFSDVEFYGVK
jgi:hypothetical protein